MDPNEQLARMTTRYGLTAEQQDQVKPILVTQQHQIQELRDDAALSREDRMAKMQTIRSDSNAKIKADVRGRCLTSPLYDWWSPLLTHS